MGVRPGISWWHQIGAVNNPFAGGSGPVTDPNAIALSVNVKNPAYGATGNGSTDDTTAVQAAINAAVTAGSSLYFPPGTYLISSGPLTLTGTSASLRIYGLQRTSTTIRLGPENSSSIGRSLFHLVTTQQLQLDSICLQGPDVIGGTAGPSNGSNIGVWHTGTGGKIVLINAWVRRFTWGVEVNTSSTTGAPSVESYGCWHEGYGTTYASTCIGIFTSTTYVDGMHLWAVDGDFYNFGDPTGGVEFGDGTGGAEYHALYCYTSWDLKVDGCLFRDAAATSIGYSVQHFDNASVTTPAGQSEITNCTFASTLNTQQGVFTNYQMGKCVTKVTDSVFESSLPRNGCLYISGDCLAKGNTFYAVKATSAGNTVGLFATTTAAQIDIIDNVFYGAIQGGYPALALEGDGQIRVRGNRFAGCTGANGFYVYATGGTTGDSVEVDDNYFAGSPAECVHVGGGPIIATVKRNRFVTSGGVAVRAATGTVNRFDVYDNDFSQSGGTNFEIDAAPTQSDVRRNFGSKGYATENGGLSTQTIAVATVNIPHLLGDASRTVTPTRISIEAGNAATAALTAQPSVSATATNIVLTFPASLTSASYAWQWWAEA